MKRKRKRKFVLSEEQRRALFIPFVPHIARTVLFRAKVGNRNNSLAVAKYLAQEIRADPSLGARKLYRTLERTWEIPGNRADYFKFAGKMLKTLGAYLEKDQPVFSKDDRDIIKILMQHPCYTIKEITAALREKHPRQKWDTLEKSVRRLVNNVPWRRHLKDFPVRLL